MHSLNVVYYLCALVLLRATYILWQTLRSPHLDIPGPLTARFTRFWYWRRLRNGRFERDNIKLHGKYGHIVRIAPNWYSIDDPSAIKTIYGIGSKWRKSDWYYGWTPLDPARVTLFTDRNIQNHANQRRNIATLYSTSSLVNYEPFVDRCADIFEKRLREHARAQRALDMGHWFQCYAFDVIACITYGERIGFLNSGKDVNGIMSSLWAAMRYSSSIGIFSEWHATIWPLTSRLPGTGGSARADIMKFIQSRVDERKIERKKRDMETRRAGSRKPVEPGLPEDFLEKLLNEQEVNPQKITPMDVFAMGMANIFAGSDTTAISLSSILYHLIKTPSTLDKLRQELEAKQAAGECASSRVTFKESLGMPYLQAVMKEALRMHPAAGLPLWRVVPGGGATVSGRFFPEDSVLGVNPWVAHKNKNVFGSDAHIFKPERWIEAGPEQLKIMESYYMPFGLGARICLGRHISELEMSKLIPRIIREFNFELTSQNPMESENCWFVKPTNFMLRVRERVQAL
ncbi:putative cytochrome P450 pisatin demethylase [Periconia macrospinosa]|uniref:Putative cytochrome P450 pisatin demethylase n=1 Tax=Periconia macrospinosa TaxID=97972 RepID=A0A2V1D2P3_9PLEO|nr:putative cytochrome P450 pisatin demethylase [Periconia macrospinosa]